MFSALAMRPMTLRFTPSRAMREHRAEHGHATAFVADHLLHVRRGLDGNAAGVESDRLADERERAPASSDRRDARGR